MGVDMLHSLRIFLSDRNAATAIEYAIIAGLLSIAIVAGAQVIGTKLSSTYFGAVAGNL
jgi:pilus assembly protein Flp/PilA